MSPVDPPPGWRPNERGVCPPEARGKRVKVLLRCGRIDGVKPVTATSKAGWPADRDAAGRSGPPMRWTLEGHPSDVLFWDLA